MSEKDGGPAFPTREKATIREGDKWIPRYEGMTLRDWFAGQALAGMAALYTQAGGTSEEIASANAAVAYLMADAMLAERAKN